MMWLEFKSQVETFLKEKGLDDCRINCIDTGILYHVPSEKLEIFLNDYQGHTELTIQG